MKIRILLILFSVMSIDTGLSQINLYEPVSENPKKNVLFIYFWTMPEFTTIMGQYERVIIHHSTSFFNSVGVRLGIGHMIDHNHNRAKRTQRS